MRVSLVAVVLCVSALFAQKGVDIQALDRTCKACDDFDQFANGTWNASNPIPPSMKRWSKRFMAADQTKNVLRDIVETSAAKGNASGNDARIGAFYGSCVDT